MDYYNRENYDRLVVSVPKWIKEEIKADAKTKGMSMSEFVNRMIIEAMYGDCVSDYFGNDEDDMP